VVLAAVDPSSTDITPLIQHPVLWALAAGVFAVVILQSVIYFKAIRKAAPAVGLTPAQVTSSVRSGAVAAVGPSLAVALVAISLLPLFGTLDRIDGSLLEAGRDLGASPARTFFRVTLPQSRQAILAGFVICALPMFGDYYTQQLLAGTPNTRMIGNAIVDSLNEPLFIQRGAALIVVLLVLLIPAILYYLRSTNRAAREFAR